MPVAAYIICATPRSGSTLLCDLLTSSRVAGAPQSFLRAEDIADYAAAWGCAPPSSSQDPPSNLAYLTAMIRAGTANTDVFGLRLMWQSVADATDRFDAAFGAGATLPGHLRGALGPTLFIHLSRTDKLAQAVSLVRARQTGLWHRAADGSERERTAPEQSPAFDAEEINNTRNALTADDLAWRAFFDQHGIRPLVLTYEELAAAPETVTHRILAALGLDPAAAIGVNVQTSRLADATTAEWIDWLIRPATVKTSGSSPR